MATIKSLLAGVLDSFLESKKAWISKQGFAQGDAVALVPYPGTSGSIDIDYTPPADGWVAFDDNGSSSALYIQGAMLFYFGKTGSCRGAIIAPVSRGGVCHISGNASANAFIVFLRLPGQS